MAHGVATHRCDRAGKYSATPPAERGFRSVSPGLDANGGPMRSLPIAGVALVALALPSLAPNASAQQPGTPMLGAPLTAPVAAQSEPPRVPRLIGRMLRD